MQRAITIFVVMELFGALQAHAQNGINVGNAKIYDNRSLAIMLEQLNQQLVNISVVDPQKLAVALGLQTGSQAQDVATSFSLSGSAVPGISTTEAPSAATGNLGITQRTTTQAAATPSTPSLPDLQTAPTFNPTFSQNVQDLLTEQINLSYRIFNLRMLLERSLTDRIKDGQPRLQTVVGIPISLDPPQSVRDQAALVEVTITPTSGAAAPALIGLMPESKTYNTSALSTKSTAFGGSAITKMFTVGFNQRRRGQVFYLYQDADTIALDQLPNPKESAKGKDSAHDDGAARGITFGWEFRPVLGRRSVAPGPRQLFAVLSLDAVDGDSAETQQFEISVRTYWRRYQRDTLTTRGTDVNSKSIKQLNPLTVYSSKQYENALTPDVSVLTWRPTDDANAVLIISGKNFFTGTKVIIGNTTHDGQASGLMIKSEKTMELRVPIKEIAIGRGYISGRYGPPVPLEPHSPSPAKGILLNKISFPLTLRENVPVDITLQDPSAGDLRELPGRPLAYVGDTVISGPFYTQAVPCEAKILGPGANSKQAICMLFHFTAPTAVMRKDTLLTIRIPFLSDAWSTTVSLYPPSTVSGVTLLGGSPNVTLVITGSGFDKDWSVFLDQPYKQGDKVAPLDVTPNQLRFAVSETTLTKYKQVIVQPPANEPGIVLPLPDSTPPKPKPAVLPGQSFQVVKNSAPAIVIKGTDLNGVKTVKFGDNMLSSQANKDGTELTVLLNRDVTKEAAPVAIRLEKDDGSFIAVTITVTAQ
ncbi:MAG: hypothetical protein ABSH28_01080 [Acidobacteriota bacterium]